METPTSATRATCAIGALLFASMLPVTLLVAPLKELISDRYAASGFWAHGFMSMNMIGAILIAPFITARSDRPGLRKKVAVWAFCLDAVLLAAMSVAPSLGWLLGLRFLEGAAHIVAISSLMALAAGWAPPEKRGRAMGLAGAAMMFGTACGTRLGGPIWHHLPGWTFQIAGGFSGTTALLALLFVSENNAHEEKTRHRGGLVPFLRLNRSLAIPYAYTLIDRLCVGVVVSTFVLYLGNVLRLGPDQRSRLLLMFLLPFALLVYPAGRLVDRIGRVWPISLGSLAFGLVFATYGMFSADRLNVVMLLSGIISAIMFAPSLALTADLAPPAQRGLAFTGFNVAGSLGFTLGPLLAGAMLSYWSSAGRSDDAYRLTFAVIGGLQVLCALGTLPFLLRLKSQRLTR